MTQLGTLLLDPSHVRTKNHNLISFHGHPQVLIKKILLRTCIFAIRVVHQSFSSAAVMQCMSCHCSLVQRYGHEAYSDVYYGWGIFIQGVFNYGLLSVGHIAILHWTRYFYGLKVIINSCMICLRLV
jgi:hypothetical protein